MFALQWLVDHGVLPKKNLAEYYASYVAGLFRSARFGAAEDHALAEMMELNYLLEQHAILRDQRGRYAIDYEKMPSAMVNLTKEMLEIEATGDHPRAEAWFAKYGQIPDHLKTTLKAASDIPIDVDPVFSFAINVK